MPAVMAARKITGFGATVGNRKKARLIPPTVASA